ncbi:secreted protein [Candidatus Thiomargarita nelsonii]|uniref:Secreted protein n=1 Tax=Candidatus Thiomargarita nelsonii TaxID=1003181 RepID=A0A176S6V5_9GAMM|nr:secreted protein [Candidatus Thiomargarita nelsonii]
MMKTTNYYKSILISAIIITSPIQASEPLWITETTSPDEIVAALSLPSNPNEIYRDIVDIVDKHPKVAIKINFEYDSSELNQRAKTLIIRSNISRRTRRGVFYFSRSC